MLLLFITKAKKLWTCTEVQRFSLVPEEDSHMSFHLDWCELQMELTRVAMKQTFVKRNVCCTEPFSQTHVWNGFLGLRGNPIVVHCFRLVHLPGYADYSIQEPYRENTLTTLFSSTKGVSALCVAMLVDR